MSYLLAQADAAFLVSIIKPLLFAAALVGWGRVVGALDKDAAYFFLARRMWNLGHLGAAVLGFGLMLSIPFFWGGFILGLIPPAGAIVGYGYYRNGQVPADKQWDFSLQQFQDWFYSRQQARTQQKAAVRLLTPKEEEELEVPRQDQPYANAHEKLEEVLEFAIPRGADQLEMMAGQQQAAIAARIDGVKYPHQEAEPAVTAETIDYLKEAAELDVEDRRKRQSGQLLIDRKDEENEKRFRHTLELETAGSTRGVQLTIRIDPGELANIPFAELGLLDNQKQQMQEVLDRPGGLVLTTGPPAQGITTLMYSLMQEHDPYTTSIVTVEHEVPFEAEGVKHNELPAGYTAQDFRSKLNALLRGDPNVVVLSHFPDEELARVAARSAEEVRFYASMQQPDTFSALKKWLQWVEEKQTAADALSAIIAGRLVRKLCETCKSPYTPDPAALKRLNLPADKVSQLYNASGQVMVKDKAQTCPTCLGLGYRGRTGVYEVMPFDDEARQYVAAQEVDRLRAHLRKQKVLWLQEAALQKVVQGVTDIKEVTRVLGEKSPSQQKSGQAKQAAKG